MKLEPATARKLRRDLLISLFIYAMPVVLMFVFFLVTGQRPWENYNPHPTTQSTIRK